MTRLPYTLHLKLAQSQTTGQLLDAAAIEVADLSAVLHGPVLIGRITPHGGRNEPRGRFLVTFRDGGREFDGDWWPAEERQWIAGEQIPPPPASLVSPDGARRAVVETDANGESHTRIEDAKGRVRLTRDDRSKDGSHGYAVVHAAWTADSRFFVAGLESSGGHQPWAHPIWIYSRAANRVFELARLGMAPVSDFQLRPPDILEVQVPKGSGNGAVDRTLPLRRIDPSRPRGAF